MDSSKNVTLDLLFRIDFHQLITWEAPEHTNKEIERKKDLLKNTFGFNRYYSRGNQGLEYVRLADLETNSLPYITYAKHLEDKNILSCCQLEQAIGIFENDMLKAFLATDSGLCYNTAAHFDAIDEIFRSGKPDEGDPNTFYGKILGNSLRLIYSPNSYNIDIAKASQHISLVFDKSQFLWELQNLKTRTNEFFDNNRALLEVEILVDSNKEIIKGAFKALSADYLT